MRKQDFWENLFDFLSDEELEDLFVLSQPHYCTTCEEFVKVEKTSEMVNSIYAGEDIKYMRNYLTCIKCDSIVDNIIIDKLNAYNKFVAYSEKLK